MIPGRTFRYAVKEGMSGHDVWALQLNLPGLVPDGIFGPVTGAAVRVYQRNRQLQVDGIAGTTTQRYLALDHLRPGQEEYKTPPGLLRSLTENESGWAVGSVNWDVPPGVDCGWIQDRVLESEFSDERFEQAFSGSYAYNVTAKKLRDRRETYRNKPGVPTDRRAWELATLHHNWPAGADKLAAGGKLSEEPAEWVSGLGIPNVTSPADWSRFYIQKATLYVSKWTT